MLMMLMAQYREIVPVILGSFSVFARIGAGTHLAGFIGHNQRATIAWSFAKFSQ
jgi:hypothetical protein